MTNESKNLINNTRRILTQRGISLRSFERKVGISGGYLTRYPVRGNGISLSTAVAICNELQMPLDDMIVDYSNNQSHMLGVQRQMANIDSQIASLQAKKTDLMQQLLMQNLNTESSGSDERIMGECPPY